MREIKFKAWNKDSKEWVSNENLQSTTKLNYDSNFLVHWHVYELLQYTGLKDKNEKEVFKDDIVCIWDINFLVYWSEDNLAWCLKSNSPYWPDRLLSSIINHSFEIKGNVHQNPELLK